MGSIVQFLNDCIGKGRYFANDAEVLLAYLLAAGRDGLIGNRKKQIVAAELGQLNFFVELFRQ